LSRARYDLIIGVVMLAALTLFVFHFFKNMKAIKHAEDIKMLYGLLFMGLVTIHIRMNFVMNIEVIHTVQFGIVALLIFPLTRSFGATLYYTVLLGFVDEWYQHAILYPEKSDYFDFNDVVLDQLGASIALIYLYSTGAEADKERSKWYKSPVLISFGIIAVTVASL